jgi:hypothetical protein
MSSMTAGRNKYARRRTSDAPPTCQTAGGGTAHQPNTAMQTAWQQAGCQSRLPATPNADLTRFSEGLAHGQTAESTPRGTATAARNGRRAIRKPVHAGRNAQVHRRGACVRCRMSCLWPSVRPSTTAWNRLNCGQMPTSRHSAQLNERAARSSANAPIVAARRWPRNSMPTARPHSSPGRSLGARSSGPEASV